MKVTLQSSVHDGKLMGNRNALSRAIMEYEGKRISITIQEAKKQRSNDQNAYYWGVVVPLVAKGITDLGEYTPNEKAHEVLKMLFLQSTSELGLPNTKSSTELNTKEFNEFIEQVQIWAADFLEIDIPEPNSQVEISYK